MLVTVLAADSTAEAAGAVVGRLFFLGIFVAMLVIGLRKRRATHGQKGTALAIVGGILLTLAVLGTIGSLAATSS